MNLYWLLQGVAYWSLVLFIVPTRYIKNLLLYAFLGGFIYTWIVQIVAVNILSRWQFKPDILTLWGIPVFFALSWFAVTLIFGYLLFLYPKYQLWVVAFFVSWGTLMNYAAEIYNQVDMIGWTMAETFMFAIFSHVLLLYVFKYMHNVDELGSKENMVEFSLSAFKKE